MKYPVYNCHKQVEAFKIEHITAQPKGTHDDTVPEQKYAEIPREGGTVDRLPIAQHTEYVLVDKTGEFVAVVDDDYMGRNPVHTGGYFVRYSNGHTSFSPAEAFEDGYTLKNLKRILHVTVSGNEDWEPTLEDLVAIRDMFIESSKDPEGAVIVTNEYINSSVEKVERTDDLELITIRAELGVA